MRDVVNGVHESALESATQAVAKLAILKQLLLDPDRNGLAKRREALGCKRQVRFQQSVEFQQGLVVKRDVVDLLEGDIRLADAVLDGLGRKARVVLPAAESFFLGGGDDPTILHQGGSGVVVVGGESENGGHQVGRTACLYDHR